MTSKATLYYTASSSLLPMTQRNEAFSNLEVISSNFVPAKSIFLNTGIRPLPFYLRPYQNADKGNLFKLLSILPTLYPKGEVWLERRLNDVLCGKATCRLVFTGRRIVGVTIETPKRPRHLKLSTIFVHPNYRGYGIGTSLLNNCFESWVAQELEQVYVTADHKITPSLSPLIATFGFNIRAIEQNRYGIDRHEVVFSWSRIKA